jgi:hypothetical protein
MELVSGVSARESGGSMEPWADTGSQGRDEIDTEFSADSWLGLRLITLRHGLSASR